MIVKTGLLVVSNPKHLSKILTDVQQRVKNTLYIQLLSVLTDPHNTYHKNIFVTPPMLSQAIYSIYSQATQQCQNLDVRVLLSNLRNNASKIQTQKTIDLVIFDKRYTPLEIDDFIHEKVPNISNDHDVLVLSCGDEKVTPDNDSRDQNVYKHVCLGGTFDRLHSAHKLLLSDAILRASEKVTVGITEESMTHGKLLYELIENVDLRVKNVTDFVQDVCPELEFNICQISDPYGPAIVDPTMELIVVSEETIRGGEKINQIRREKNLPELKIVPIPFVDEPNPQPKEESKVSSSTLRLRLLGTLLNPLEKKDIPKRPYVIGITGGIASGKSGVAGHLENLGNLIVNCDKVGHKVYEKGAPCYAPLVAHFGTKIVGTDGQIDRKALGGIVFKEPKEMQKLNEIVWPAIANEVQTIIRDSGKDIVFVEAAILVQAGWQKFCHEVWTTIVPREEAIKRLVTRNNLTEEEALSRIESQPPNTDYVKNANVVFCPLWEPEYTKLQVLRAWDLLQKRLAKS